MIRAVVFDLDGTLIDSDRDIARAVNVALRALGREPLPLVRIRAMIGHGARHLLASALATDDEALISRAREAFIAHYAADPVAETVVYDGIRALLEALAAAGIATAVATNKPALVTQRIVAALHLGLATASADEVPERKPDPAVLRLALARAGVAAAPHEVAYVGDMGVDVETARRYGARAIGVAWGFSPQTARDAGPDAWVEHPREILDAIALW